MPIVTIDFFEGRDTETKRELAKRLTDEICQTLECKPEAVQILFRDIKRENLASAGVLWCDK